MDISPTIHKAEAWMDEIEGVTGVGQGERDGKVVVEVYVRDPATAEKLPAELDGYPVVATVTDEFTRY
jgi:hypothetical protein